MFTVDRSFETVDLRASINALNTTTVYRIIIVSVDCIIKIKIKQLRHAMLMAHDSSKLSHLKLL